MRKELEGFYSSITIFHVGDLFCRMKIGGLAGLGEEDGHSLEEASLKTSRK